MKYVTYEVTVCCDEETTADDIEKQIWEKLENMKVVNTELKETGEIEEYRGIL